MERIREISADTEIKLFLESNKSPHPLPKEVSFEHYKSSMDLVKYRQQLATRQLLQSVHITESEEGDDQVVIHLTPEEKVRKLLAQLMTESKPIASEEKKYLFESIKLLEVRSVVAEMFLSFVTPRRIQDKESFQTVGQLCCRWLDVLLSEQSGTLKDLNAVLQIS